MKFLLSVSAAALLAIGAAASQVPVGAPGAPVAVDAAPAPVPLLRAEVVARYPHDTGAFTEGLIWSDGALYESVGREGESEIRRVRLNDGKVQARATIPPSQFGEGLARWKDQLVSLTWHDGIAYRWNARTLKKVGTARYTGEGWGLTADAAGLWLSDGTPVLRHLDPVTFAETKKLTVTIRGRRLPQVNELEMVDGAILANVWHSPYLVRIDPVNGQVTAVIDLRPIVAEVGARDAEAVANGIAWDAAGKRLFVTGKLWPTIYEVKLVPES